MRLAKSIRDVQVDEKFQNGTMHTNNKISGRQDYEKLKNGTLHATSKINAEQVGATNVAPIFSCCTLNAAMFCKNKSCKKRI